MRKLRKISAQRADAMWDVIDYVLDIHEWCEQPYVLDDRCGHQHYTYCHDRTDGKLCEGCAVEKTARYLLSRKYKDEG